MKTKTFASDNNTGVHPDIMAAIIRANQGDEIGYGNDDYTKKAVSKFKRLLGENIEVFFVGNGTAANVLGISVVAQSFNAVICAESAHINTSECGAPEKFTGSKLLAIPTTNGKITVKQIARHVRGIGDCHNVQPKVISITQPTEIGTAYTEKEVRSIADYAHENNMFLHVDGARIANAVVALNTDIRNLTSFVGVDILSFGGTKNGMMFGEAVIFFDRTLAKDFEFARKQGLHLFSKMRFISAQFEELLSNDLWLKNARQANNMAKLLARKLKKIPRVAITQKVQTNSVFVKIPKRDIPRLMEKYFFYIWNEENSDVRFVTSFNTRKKDVRLFADFFKKTVTDQ